jgi:hypothetical protein
MTTRELIEMASLDAMGLLDDQEREAFERAFGAASATVQRQVRREQGRLADAEALLPDVEPAAGLRARVIYAVRDAMRGVAARDGSDVLARLAPAGVALRRNVSPLWRAACIGFATATVVLMAAGFSLQREWSRAAAASQDGDLASLITKDLGSQFANALTNPNTTRMAFVPASLDADVRSGSASIYLDAETGMAWLICNQMPVIEGAYRLAVLDPAGQVVETIAEFAYTGGVRGHQIQNLAMKPGSMLAIVAPQSASPLLVSAGA